MLNPFLLVHSRADLLPDLSLKLLSFYKQGMVLALIFLGSFTTKGYLTAFYDVTTDQEQSVENTV